MVPDFENMQYEGRLQGAGQFEKALMLRRNYKNIRIISKRVGVILRIQGVMGSRVRVTRSEAAALNAKELQRIECLAKIIRTLFKDIR